MGGNWQPQQERAPSVLRAETPTVARLIALIALLPTAVGLLAVLLTRFEIRYAVGPTTGYFLLIVGLAGLIYHAFTDKELQYRRIYWMAGLSLLVIGALLRALPYRTVAGGLFLSDGAPALGVGLCFLIGFLRNETDEALRSLTLRIILVLGIILALGGLIGGAASEMYLMGEGAVLLLLGLLFLTTFIALQPTASDAGYYVGVGVGVAGAAMILLTIIWLVAPGTVPFVRWSAGQPGSPFLMIYAGLEYLLLAIGVCSDSKLVVLTRRELASFFYSPIAYVVLVCSALLGWYTFNRFVGDMWDQGTRAVGLFEPIVIFMILDLIPIYSIMIMIPIITMRLLSEEKRVGTLEVLLTAPVNEATVVTSKFLAALRFFLLCWYPWGVYLVALRVVGEETFEYRPLLTFAISLTLTGASFLAMGVFFSSLTRSQIAAAILTTVGMVFFFAVFFIRRDVVPASSPWNSILLYISFIDLWIQSLLGTFQPRYLVFYLSATVFWLFLSTKVLEARKWS